jgi:hypothetical protein
VYPYPEIAGALLVLDLTEIFPCLMGEPGASLHDASVLVNAHDAARGPFAGPAGAALAAAGAAAGGGRRGNGGARRERRNRGGGGGGRGRGRGRRN